MGGWLEGRTALITGGGSGLGAAIAERFVAEGARVAILDKSEEKIAEITERSKGAITGIAGDVRNLADNQNGVGYATDKFGHLDVFIGNAAIWDYNAKLVDLPEENIEAAFDELFAINVKGYLLGAKAAQKALVKAKGSMIFTVSNAGFYVDGGGPLYTASKHAVVGLIKQLAFECAPHVRVNGVAPGAISTDLRGPASLGLAEMSIANVPLGQALKGALPLSDLPTAHDYTGAYVLFASKENIPMTTGAILNCDGGFGVRGLSSASAGEDLPQRLGLTTKQ